VRKKVLPQKAQNLQLRNYGNKYERF